MGVVSVQDLYKRLKYLDDYGYFDDLDGFVPEMQNAVKDIKKWIKETRNEKSVYVSTGQ